MTKNEAPTFEDLLKEEDQQGSSIGFSTEKTRHSDRPQVSGDGFGGRFFSPVSEVVVVGRQNKELSRSETVYVRS